MLCTAGLLQLYPPRPNTLLAFNNGVCLEMASTVPRPGPANLGPNAGLDEWLEEAKQCHYLPERAMKELCEKVKEILMEGLFVLDSRLELQLT